MVDSATGRAAEDGEGMSAVELGRTGASELGATVEAAAAGQRAQTPGGAAKRGSDGLGRLAHPVTVQPGRAVSS